MSIEPCFEVLNIVLPFVLSLLGLVACARLRRMATHKKFKRSFQSQLGNLLTLRTP